jgi:flagellar hook-basal body complex protein FliE
MDVLTAPLSLTSLGSTAATGSTLSVRDLLRAGEESTSPEAVGDLPIAPGGGSVAPAFGQILNGFLQQVDASQHRADSMVESLALGEPVDVHQVMMSLNEASNAMHLTLQVRSKLLDAYQEVMRMPI